MSVMKVLCLLLLHVALVTPGTQICQNPDEDAYSITTCGEKGEPDIENLKLQMTVMDLRLRHLQSNLENKAKAIENLKLQMTVMDSRMRDLQSTLENQEKVFSFGKDIARSRSKNYIMNRLEVTYDEAKTICVSGGGQLAVPRTQEENQAIFSLRKKVETHTFMGINDLQHRGDFRDLSGQVITYFNWRAGEPNNLRNEEHCVEMWDDGGWNDENCASKRFFICEF
ncbi:pulmonary surfactant-associated protein A-like isoform X3 [Lithobates pipiens]